MTKRKTALRIPFRFGAVTTTEVSQAVLHVRVIDRNGESAVGVSAECLLPKWFDKNPELSDADNIAQLERSLDIAISLYRDAGFHTLFGLSAAVYPVQQAQCIQEMLNPLVASYGPALLDRAILDATARLLDISFQELVTSNLPGVRADLTPDLAGFDISAFLGELRPAAQIGVRHTVGLLDALTQDDVVAEAPDDGLPVTLVDVVRHYGCKYFKLKVAGNVAADLSRLERIASVLDANGAEYWCTLDGNEQYDSFEGIEALWRLMTESPALRRLTASILLIEQPIRRAVAMERSVEPLSRLRAVIIDESDGTYDAFPHAIRLGYNGVSSKTCKGLYKSILNAARVAHRNSVTEAPGRYFLSAEDLITWPGISTQQDLALVSLLGLEHVERNAHHYIDGMSFAADDEQNAFVALHPDLYHRSPGHSARLRVERGLLSIGSLACKGYAVGIAPVM
ncbi:mandelate racemase [Agrobacterium tumefaciens]|uniref:mandelate racemase n=1 Tax=Agrobacterium tumefaciens TaxID=358 RepID=UPI0012B7CE6F|nr:mandelate racemase [Agrobacterium tumefaciens]MQB08045.1 mandelate racemase [Agrobacterium tumefaciens]